MISVSDLYEHGTRAYYRAHEWLRNNAKHEPMRKGRKTYWHEDDIAAFKERRQFITNWSDLILELFAEPATIYDALDMLAERGKFVELEAMRQAVYTYERKGMLTKVGRQKGKGLPRTLWVFVND